MFGNPGGSGGVAAGHAARNPSPLAMHWPAASASPVFWVCSAGTAFESRNALSPPWPGDASAGAAETTIKIADHAAMRDRVSKEPSTSTVRRQGDNPDLFFALGSPIR